jgi:MSHA biogenesis protein MshN
MSLINKMLQDLDARRSEVTNSVPFGSQIRIVPERRGIHAAWWVALALGASLVGVIAWTLHWSAPTKNAARVESGAIPLKLTGGLNMPKSAPVPASTPNLTEQNTNSAAAAPVVSATAPAQEDKQGSATSSPAPGTIKPAAQTKPAPANKLIEPATVPKAKLKEVVAAPLSERKAPKLAAVAPAPVPDIVPPTTAMPAATGNKQVKELSSQQRAENEYRKAILLIQQGKASEAVSGLEVALQLDAYHAAARQNLIGALLDSKRQDEALRRAREGLDLDPAQTGLAMIMSRLQVEKGELRSAIDTLQRSLRYATDRADYQAFLAALLQRDARNKEAAEHYLQALQKSPQTGVWWMGLGISLQAESRLPEAQEAFSRAKATNSLSPELLAFVESKLKQLQR